MPALHVVTGAGPVGTTVAEQLVARGDRVRLLTRSGSGPDLPGIERQAVDVRDEAALEAALDGAGSVFHCVHAAYDVRSWERELPAAEQAVLRAAGERVVVFPESLYAYADSAVTMTEDSPRTAVGGKRGVRTRLVGARLASSTPTVSVVASDFFGPYVRTAHAGERVLVPLLTGKRVRVLGDADQLHSFTYVPDLAAAMITAAGDAGTWGTVLHAPTGPALTQRRLVEALAAAAGTEARVGVIPGWVLRAGGRAGGAVDARARRDALPVRVAVRHELGPHRGAPRSCPHAARGRGEGDRRLVAGLRSRRGARHHSRRMIVSALAGGYPRRAACQRCGARPALRLARDHRARRG